MNDPSDTDSMDQFTATASLLAEPSRAVMLLKLLNGRALPASELAAAANVSPQTASGHLAKLTQARLVAVEAQGRHRYYRLAAPEVADALEAILVLLPQACSGHRDSKEPVLGTLAYARTCYSHLAGWLGVRIADGLRNKGYLQPADNKAFVVTGAGRAWFETIGVALPKEDQDVSPRQARQCLDWTERRPHLAGKLGVNLYRRLIELHWIAGIPDSRAVRITLLGRNSLWDHLGVSAGR